MVSKSGGQVQLEWDEAEMEEVLDRLEAFGRVIYTASHSQHVNFDTAWTGSKPPFPALRGWVHRKWNDLGGGLKNAALEDENGNPTGIQPGSEEHKDAVTWIVVHSIAKNGIKGVHFAERALSHGQSKADAVARQYGGSDDPDASRHIVEDITDLMFGESQDIIAEEAYDRGTLLQSGQVEVQDEPFREGG